ncbi:MAG: hypothetical protein HZA01_03430, partial [Nitrospinae bacterium]|nr:hypothetical protein [Nitrospinota bacterium]
LVDSREQLPYSFPGHRTVVEKLDVGDYGLAGCPEIAIERKSVDDLIVGASPVAGNALRLK